ncbi:MAG TPA: DUF1232 domain-containing protein [Thermoanaerobaculia bacterium]|nr:DUF1232 domain-containing protein [Thermoanaerobaculia bacterium]
MTVQTHDDLVPMPAGRANRFYDRLRQRIHAYLERRGALAERFGDYLLLVPDVFILLWRLTTDARVSGKNKVLLGSGIAYFIFPFDIVPEAIVGPIGFLDDLVFAVYVLNKMLSDTDPEILREHWSGHGDLLESMRKVLSGADRLVTDKVADKLKKKMP